MITDHFAVAVYQQAVGCDLLYELMRKIGRLAFPIYCFLLVEGFFHTSDLPGYIRNCFIFAVLSEIPFDMAVFGRVVYPYGQNVYFTLSIGLCTLAILDRMRYRTGSFAAGLAVAGVSACIAEICGADYGWRGILFILLFYVTKEMKEWVRDLIGVCAFAYEVTAPLALIPIHFYNGERGRQPKYLFYAIYPVHLLVFGLVRACLDSAMI